MVTPGAFLTRLTLAVAVTWTLLAMAYMTARVLKLRRALNTPLKLGEPGRCILPHQFNVEEAQWLNRSPSSGRAGEGQNVRRAPEHSFDRRRGHCRVPSTSCVRTGHVGIVTVFGRVTGRR